MVIRSKYQDDDDGRGLYWDGTPEEEAEYIAQQNDYRTLRAAAHVPLQEQLDMQYWDAVNGTTNWLDYVANIKEQYPKPA